MHWLIYGLQEKRKNIVMRFQSPLVYVIIEPRQENQPCGCESLVDTDQPRYQLSLIRVFAFRMLEKYINQRNRNVSKNWKP